jgi:hypothetical protein
MKVRVMNVHICYSVMRKSLVLGMAVALLGASTSIAHWDMSAWTHHEACTGGSDIIDPINFVYYGTPADDTGANLMTYWVAHWTNTGGSDQWAVTHGICDYRDEQYANDSEIFNRDHIRFWRNYDRDTKGRWETAGDGHHDVDTWCGHISGSFDHGRDQLIHDAKKAATSWKYVWRGNSGPKRQCNGQDTHSDGYQAWMLLTS